MTKTDKDYDSTANGKVEITFTYQCDSAYYKDSSKTYKKYWYCDGHGGLHPIYSQFLYWNLYKWRVHDRSVYVPCHGSAHEYMRYLSASKYRYLSYNGTIEQVYKDVKYMDIVDCHVWRLAGGVADGLAGNTMVEETATQVITPIIEMACNNMGFTLDNTSQRKSVALALNCKNVFTPFLTICKELILFTTSRIVAISQTTNS